MESPIKFAETVILIDTAYLNLLIADVKKNFEVQLKRELQQIQIQDLMLYFAYDAGLESENNEIQVLFLYNEGETSLIHTTPSDLETELNNVSFRHQLGEFTFYTYSTQEFVEMASLYYESLNLLLEAKETKRIVLIAHNEEYGEVIEAALADGEEKTIFQYRMDEPTHGLEIAWSYLAYPVMQGLGIKSSELN